MSVFENDFCRHDDFVSEHFRENYQILHDLDYVQHRSLLTGDSDCDYSNVWFPSDEYLHAYNEDS